MAKFIDCTSLSVSYDVMGRATVSYTVVHDTEGFEVFSPISFGGRTFEGYVVNASLNQIPNSVGWWETQVTMITTTSDSDLSL